jgi:hypothetical protein
MEMPKEQSYNLVCHHMSATVYTLSIQHNIVLSKLRENNHIYMVQQDRGPFVIRGDTNPQI